MIYCTTLCALLQFLIINIMYILLNASVQSFYCRIKKKIRTILLALLMLSLDLRSVLLMLTKTKRMYHCRLMN